MKGIATLVLAAALPTLVLADPPSDSAKAEMSKIAQMAGHWKGSGWIDRGGVRSESNSEEWIEMRLDGRALLVEGLHRDVKTNAENHHALAIIAWDDHQRMYRFLSALAAGQTGYFPAKLEGKKFIWSIPIPNGPTSRFTISLEDPDKWNEVGEQSRDGGVTWSKFFEMNLTRVK